MSIIPRLTPLDTPSIVGPAMGFLKTFWYSMPETESRMAHRSVMPMTPARSVTAQYPGTFARIHSLECADHACVSTARPL